MLFIAFTHLEVLSNGLKHQLCGTSTIMFSFFLGAYESSENMKILQEKFSKEAIQSKTSKMDKESIL
jgi:hypothetical protein